MELKKGYSETDLGILPTDWEIKLLEEVAEVIDPHPSHRAPVVDPNGVPFVGIGDLNENGDLVSVDVRYVPSSVLIEHQRRYNLSDRLIGLGRVASIGKVIDFKDSFEKYTISPTLGLIKANTIERYFLFNVLRSNLVKNQFRSIMSGSTRSSVGMIVLRKLLVPCPKNEAEQTAIATALSDIDNLITGLEKLIAKKKAIKQGALQDLLRPKQGWVVKKLGDIADKSKKWSFTGGPFGSNLKSSDYTESGIRVLQLQNIGDGQFINDSEIYTSSTKSDELISCNIYPGDIILSKMGDPVARACIIPNYHDRYLMCSDGIRLSVNEDENDVYFIYAYINSPAFRMQAENNSTGSTRRRIGLVTLKNLELMIPNVYEQKAIGKLLFTMESEINALKASLYKYKLLKQGMMQELLTGNTRLV